MSWCGPEQIPSFIMTTFAMASFFVLLAGEIGIAPATPITVVLVLVALRLRVVLAAAAYHGP